MSVHMHGELSKRGLTPDVNLPEPKRRVPWWNLKYWYNRLMVAWSGDDNDYSHEGHTESSLEELRKSVKEAYFEKGVAFALNWLTPEEMNIATRTAMTRYPAVSSRMVAGVAEIVLDQLQARIKSRLNGSTQAGDSVGLTPTTETAADTDT